MWQAALRLLPAKSICGMNPGKSQVNPCETGRWRGNFPRFSRESLCGGSRCRWFTAKTRGWVVAKFRALQEEPAVVMPASRLIVNEHVMLMRLSRELLLVRIALWFEYRKLRRYVQETKAERRSPDAPAWFQRQVWAPQAWDLRSAPCDPNQPLLLPHSEVVVCFGAAL